MLCSSPDYPLFLIAVVFRYARPRARAFDPVLERALRILRVGRYVQAFRAVFGRWARGAAMLLLGDLIFLLVSKDTGTLWDPLGGAAYRAVQLLGSGPAPTWPVALVGQWIAGTSVLAAAIVFGRRGAGWRSSERGQRAVARLIVFVLAVVGATVAIASQAGRLDAGTVEVVAHGHQLVRGVLGIAIGASYTELHKPLARVRVLFVVSCLFYHAWAAAMPGPYRYLLALLLGTIVLDYYLAIWIEGTESPRARKALVIVSLVSNLGILGFFKYTNFFTQDVLHLPVRPLHLILPAGISFHTFQSLSYTLADSVRDVRAVLPAARRRPDRARTRSAAAARRAADARAREGRERPVAHHRRPVQEARACRPARARHRRPRVRGAHALLAPRSPRRRLRLRTPVLSRLLRLLRHRDRLGCAPGLRPAGELQDAVSIGVAARILAALAHLAVDLAARLPLRPAGRQPRCPVAHVRQPVADDAPRRPVARRVLGVHRVGRAPRLRPRDHALLPAHARRDAHRRRLDVRVDRGARCHRLLVRGVRDAVLVGHVDTARARVCHAHAAVGGRHRLARRRQTGAHAAGRRRAPRRPPERRAAHRDVSVRRRLSRGAAVERPHDLAAARARDVLLCARRRRRCLAAAPGRAERVRPPRARGLPRLQLRLPRLDLLPRDLVRQRARHPRATRPRRARPREPRPDRHDGARRRLPLPLLPRW